MPAFNLTFSKVAKDRFFAEPDIKGLRIRLVDGDPQFKAATMLTPGTWPLEERQRGGTAITVTGRDAADFLADSGTQDGDYLILTEREEDGWVKTRRYVPRPTAERPNRIWPAVRLWITEPLSVSAAGEVEPVDIEFKKEDHVPGTYYSFTARLPSSTPEQDGRRQVSVLKTWRWCKHHLGPEGEGGKYWSIACRFVPAYSIEVGDKGVVPVRNGGHFQVTVSIADQGRAMDFYLANGASSTGTVDVIRA